MSEAAVNPLQSAGANGASAGSRISDDVASLRSATAQLTSSGQLFEMEELEIRGVPSRTWKLAPKTSRDVLELSLAHKDRDFLVYEDEHVTFEQHYRQVAIVAHRLRSDFGVEKGDHVAIAMRNLPEWVVAYWGALAAGAVVVPLNAWWTADELQFGLSDSESRVLFSDVERADRLLGVLDELPALKAVIVANEHRHQEGGGWTPPNVARLPMEEFSSWLGEVEPEATMPEIALEPEDGATIFYTSGTTGRPKGALGTHRNMCTNLMSLFFLNTRSAMRFSNRDQASSNEQSGAQNAFLLSVPLFHVTGSLSIMVTNTAAGGKLVMMHHFNPERALELIERERISVFGGVPSMVMRVLDSPDFSKRDTSSVRGVSYGGAPAHQGALPRRTAEQRVRADRDLVGDHYEQWGRLRTQARQRRSCRAGVRRGSGARGLRGGRARSLLAGRTRNHWRAVDQRSQRGRRLLEKTRGDRSGDHQRLAPHR
jgi:long-chain acyl-CoA synthetase